VAVLSAGGRALELLVRVLHLMLGLVSQLVNAVSAVKSGADLFISLNKALQLSSQVFVLSNQDVAVMLKSINFFLNVTVLSLESLVRETEVTLFTARNVQVVLSSTALAIQIVKS